MKLFQRRVNVAPSPPIVVPPELQAYYQPQAVAPTSNRRRIVLIAAGVVVLAAIVVGIVLVTVHVTKNKPVTPVIKVQTANNGLPKTSGQPDAVPNNTQVNTKSVAQPAQ